MIRDVGRVGRVVDNDPTRSVADLDTRRLVAATKVERVAVNALPNEFAFCRRTARDSAVALALGGAGVTA